MAAVIEHYQRHRAADGTHRLAFSAPSYRQWLTSDYLLDQLGLDPAATQKRLGDGFYEQRLINEQVAKLTGHRFISGYANDEEQYKALMTNGATFAKQFQLTPGVALTAAQMAQLTSDIVWLVAQSVTLPDGSTQTALVPQVDRIAGLYVNGGSGELKAHADNNANILAGVIANQGSGSTAITALRDINLGTVGVGEAQSYQIKGFSGHNTQAADVGSVILGNGDVRLQAGSDANLRAATVAAEGDLTVSAVRDLDIQAGQAQSSTAGSVTNTSKSLLKKTTTQSLNRTSVSDVVSSSLSGTTVTLAAGNDIRAEAAQLHADEAMTLSAGRDIALTTATRTTEQEHAYQSKTSATGLGKFVGATVLASGIPGAEFGAAAVLGGKANANSGTTATHEAVGTTLSAGSLEVVSGRDTALQGTTIVADGDITAVAGRNLTIESAENTRTESSAQQSGKSGLLGTWYNPSIGKLKSSDSADGNSTTHTASQVASLQGDVTLVAGEQYRQTGSSVAAFGQAGQDADGAGGNVNVLAKSVLINEAVNTEQTNARGKSSSTVLGGSANVGGISTDTARSLVDSTRSTSESSDSRMQALAAANVAFGAKNAYDTASQLASGSGTSYKVTATLSHNKSEYETTSTATQAVGSSIAGANNVNIVATGGDQDSSIHAIGSAIAAGKTVNLAADNHVTLEASQNTFEQHGTNKSSGQSVGVGYAGGSQNGITIELGASRGKGSDDQSEVTHTNIHVSGGEGVNIISGGDLNSLDVSAGRDLNVRSTTISDSSNTGTYASSHTRLDRIAGLYVNGGNGDLKAKAGNDANIVAGVTANQGGGSISLTAKHDLNLGSLQELSATSIVSSPGNFSWTSGSNEVGSQIVGQKNVVLTAGHDINAREVGVDAGGLLLANADNDFNIKAGRTTEETHGEAQSSYRKGLAKITSTVSADHEEDLSQASTFTGGLVTLSAGNNLTAEGVQIHGDKGVAVLAGFAVPIISVFSLSFQYDFKYVITRMIFEMFVDPGFILLAMIVPGLSLVILALIGRHGKKLPSKNK